MERRKVGTWAFVTGACSLILIGIGMMPVSVLRSAPVYAAELNVDNLPADAKAFRAQVEQILGKVNGVIDKAKETKGADPALLDLIQTRDNILREVPKVEHIPDGAKWTSKEAQASVQSMLKLLKTQYEKVAA